MTEIRSRVNVLVVNKNKFVLVFRHKNNEDYYAIPGGGIEEGETSEEAAIREVDEELGLHLNKITLISEVKTDTRHDFNFLSETDDTKINVTGPELKHLNMAEDLFKPEWHTRDSYRRDIKIYPESGREMFKKFISDIK
ncbi:MAG TPA: NUDIX domain-containing protein [Candidatus Woesebacteria bacterium]|nr:NUDIX domain-containing protein [Candidatus Woesebacteria bacterium]HPR99822.1 NUDIX domain-containing protein [Candidatus Woesebacteria bacterium]